MIGSNVSKWLAELKSGNPEEKVKAANHLLSTSEWYFDNKKVSTNERLKLVNELIQSLDPSSPPVVRRCVVYLSGILKASSETVIDLLAKALKDENEQVQILAVWSSGRLGEEASPLIPILASLWKSPDREVRWRISWALKEISVIDNSLSEILLALSKDKDKTVRMYALDAIPYCIDKIDSKIERIVKRSLKNNDESTDAACRVIQKTQYNWNNSKKRLLKLVKTNSPEAVLALCIQWPETVWEPSINQWLRENSGYWWAEDLLKGKGLKVQ